MGRPQAVARRVERRVRRHFSLCMVRPEFWSTGIFVERSGAWRQLNPCVSTAVVDGNPRRWKVRVSKRTHGDAHRLIVPVFGVEDGSPANWAEPEYELGSLIPDTNVFVGGTEYFERSREAGQCCEDTAGPLLASETVANANALWFAFDLNAQLSTGTRGCPGRHWAPRRMIFVMPNDRAERPAGRGTPLPPRCSAPARSSGVLAGIRGAGSLKLHPIPHVALEPLLE